ncbi:retropepsin-like aspartic protease family protein [Paludisphaera borealis]|nr:retropepsin-like aspartic protease [Paludisphaera borealis]
MTGLACLLVGSATASVRAQAVPAADATLKTHELKRSGGTYVLPEEAKVLKSIKELAALHQKVGEGLDYLNMIEAGAEERKAYLEELSQNYQASQQQIQAFDQEIAQIEQAGVNSIVMNAQRNQIVAQRNSVVATSNQMAERLNSLRRMDRDTDQKHQVLGEVTQRREQFLEAMLELRRLVDATLAKYQGLAKDDEIVRALNDVSTASKSKIKYKLGPSRDFLAAVQRLEKAEGAVSSDTIKCRREGGVFVVDAMLNGKLAVPMIYDTGASEVVISSELADELGMKPKDTDPVVKHRIADGSVVEARKMTLPSVRVGKVTVKNVVCSVMPGNKADLAPLLGQAFLSRVDHKMSSDGRLAVAKVEQDEAAAKVGRASRQTKAPAKATTRNRRTRGAARKPATTQEPDPGADLADPE